MNVELGQLSRVFLMSPRWNGCSEASAKQARSRLAPRAPPLINACPILKLFELGNNLSLYLALEQHVGTQDIGARQAGH